MDTVPFQVAAGSVEVFGGSRVSVTGKDLCVAEGTPASSAFVIAACLSEDRAF